MLEEPSQVVQKENIRFPLDQLHAEEAAQVVSTAQKELERLMTARPPLAQLDITVQVGSGRHVQMESGVMQAAQQQQIAS